MGKNKRKTPPTPTAMLQGHGGGSPKKKKKRRKSESQEEEAVTTPSPLLSHFSPLASLGLTPSKKKKKKRKELEAKQNGLMKAEEEVEVKTKKKKEKVEMELPKRIEEVEGGKKKKRKEEKTVKEDMRSQEEEEEEEASAKRSPKKKGKKKTFPAPLPALLLPSAPVTPKLEKMEVEEEEEEDNSWAEEATQELLSRVASQVPPGRDTRSCRHRIKNVDWGAAALPGRSPEACQDHFMALYRKIDHLKTLTTVVGEMSKLVGSGMKDRRNRPLMPLHRFLKDYYTTEMKADIKKKGGNMFKLGHEAWRQLPAEQKEVYIRTYKDECSRLMLMHREEPVVKVPKQPYQLCWEAEKPPGTALRIRSYYTSITPFQQLPYIRQALEDTMRYTADLEAHLKIDPDFQPPPCPSFPKNDLKTYLEAQGCPMAPPLRASLMFYRELSDKGQLKAVPGLKRMAEAMLLYKPLSREQKAHYREMVEQALRQYEEELKEWSCEQDEVTLYALKKHRESVPYINQMHQKNKTKHVKLETVFPHQAPANTSCPKFLNEPPRPPSAPYNLFTAKLRATTDLGLSGPELQKALKEGWKALSDDEKAVYISRCRALHKHYEKDLKKYVQEMDFKTRTLYLGHLRHTLFRFFNNRDVFAVEFPNSAQYPLFVKGLESPTSPNKTQIKLLPSSDEDDGDEEEDEDVEEIAPPMSPPKKKRTVSPLLFSSLETSPSNSRSMMKPGSLNARTTPPKKSKVLTPLPIPYSETESMEDFAFSPRHSAFATPVKILKAKKNAGGGKKGKAAAAPTAPTAPESESEEESEEEEEVVTPAWRSGPPKTPITTPAAKKNAGGGGGGGKKGKAAAAPTAPESESEEESEEEDNVTPAWQSGPPNTTAAQQQQQQDSSSSGFSDSDSTE